MNNYSITITQCKSIKFPSQKAQNDWIDLKNKTTMCLQETHFSFKDT